MLSIPQYLLESSFCLLIFYGFYHYFLKKETFFQLNRFYLLATPLLSLLIPYWNISLRKKEVTATAFDEVIFPAIQSAQHVQAVFWEQMREPTPVFSLSVADVIMAIYMGGVLLMSFTLLKSLWGLSRLIRKGNRQKREGFTQVEMPNTFPAASFFGYIFYNQQITDEQQLILEHEKVHIRQWHSMDVLAMEFVVIIKWFNPLIYFFRNALKATHEFIADQFVIEQKTNRTTYAFLLVNASQQQTAPLANTFYSLTKERLKMMLQQPSKNWKAAKYIMVLPIILVLMSLFSFNLLEEFQPLKEGMEEMDAAFNELGNKTIFELDAPVEKHPNDLSEYTIKWGEIKLPFSPPTSDGFPVYPHELIDKEEFLAAIHKPITVWKNEKKESVQFIDFEVFAAIVDGNTTTIGNSKIGLQLTPNVKPIELIENMPSFEKISMEDLFISINVDELGLKSSLQVGKGMTFWDIPVQVKTEPLERFPYQVVLSDTEKTKLKIDTTQKENKAIVQLYKDPKKYQIIHIPSFETSTRLLKIEARKGELKVGTPANKILLPEYLDFQPQDLKLSFGKINVNPTGKYALNDFQSSSKQSITLFQKEQELTIKQFQLAIFEKEKGWKSVEVTDWQSDKVQQFIADLSPKSSVYFTQMMIETGGQEYYLPQTFLLMLEKAKNPDSLESNELFPTIKEHDSYQIQWGKYIFDCKTMKTSRRYCHCENKYIAKADLKSMNRSGIKFLKDGKKIDFKNIKITSLDGAVHCEKEDLMVFNDTQEKYDKKACIWNAFDEKDKGSISFQTDEFAGVWLKFMVSTPLADQPIPEEGIIIGKNKIRVNDFRGRRSKTALPLESVIQTLKEPNKYFEYFDSQSPIKTIRFVHYGYGENTYYHLDNPKEMANYRQKFDKEENPKVVIYATTFPSNDTTEIRLSSAGFNLDKESIIHSHTWGEHKINFKSRYLSLQKKELLELIKQHTILTPSDKEIKGVENIDFSFRYRPNVQCAFEGTWEAMKKNPCFIENLSHLQKGDVLTFPKLKTVGQLDLEYSTWVNIVIEDEAEKEEILIQKTLQSNKFGNEFNANGKHWQQQNIPFAELVKTLTQSRHGKLEITGNNQPNLDVYFYSPDATLSKEVIYEKVFNALKRQYNITTKTKYQEQTSWFLSEGDPEKLNQFTEEKVMPNLEYFNDQTREKGLDPVGPINYNWFADRYLPMEYGIEVTDLTEFSGRYILPLKTKSLKSLQKQLKKDYGLVLKEQKRTIPIMVVRFE